MKKVFVAGLYSTTHKPGNHLINCLENMRRGLRACAELLVLGYAPFCPWLDFMFFLVLRDDEEITAPLIKQYSTEYLKICDAVLVISNDAGSSVNEEISLAEALGIPVVYRMEDLQNE